MTNKPRSAYLHIPFCHRRCFYCDFAVVPLGDRASGEIGPGSASIKSYLKLLHREIDLIKEGDPLSTVYIGGGTPSLLSPLQIRALLDHLRNVFGFQDGAEITLEVDPASFEERELDDFLEIGINRFSLGGQSFDDQLLKKLGRRHNCNQLLEACSWLDEKFRNGEILSWSLDLIQNLPGHNLDLWSSQLMQALQTSAPHLSLYDLSIEPGTVFYRRKSKDEIKLPNDDLAVEINRLTNSTLTKVGFSRYEISNFALPGHPSRHNRVYWSGAGWWSFGMGSTSAPWGNRFSRPRTREGYKNWLEQQEQLGLDASLLSKNARPIDFDEQLMVGLRRREGIDLKSLANLWGWDFEQSQEYLNSLQLRWHDFSKRGLLQNCGERIVLTNPEGIEISNQILVEMILWWESLPDAAVHPPTL